MNYRESHLAVDKGQTYEDCFQSNPHRAMIWRIERQILNTIVTKYMGTQPFKLLDFACGTGRVLCHLERYATESTGVDVSQSMLEVVRGKVQSSKLFEADITRSDVLKDERFDLITAFRFFPNAEPRLRHEAMQALVGLMAPDGYLVFNNHKNDTSSVTQLARLLRRGSRTDADMSYPEVKALTEQSGLKIVDRFHIGVLPVTETHPLLPERALYLIEKPLTWCPFAWRLSRYHIFVCKRDSDVA